eukprot:SM000360S13673  [mRNA]  locus=s360:10527:11105:+ [translate_table: standard]
MDSRKEAFRKYLESSGGLDALTKGTSCSPPAARQPAHSLRPGPDQAGYIRAAVGGPSTAEVDHLKSQNQDLKSKLDDLRSKYEQALQRVRVTLLWVTIVSL